MTTFIFMLKIEVNRVHPFPEQIINLSILLGLLHFPPSDMLCIFGEAAVICMSANTAPPPPPTMD